MKKPASKRACQLHRLAVFAASLLVSLSVLAIKTYFTTMQTADAMADIRADVKTLLRNDAIHEQREADGEKDRDRLRIRLDRLEDRGRNGER